MKDETKSLQDRVNEALDIAVFENDYRELMDADAGEVASDLMDNCSELEPASQGDEPDDDYEDAVKACVLDYQR